MPIQTLIPLHDYRDWYVLPNSQISLLPTCSRVLIFYFFSDLCLVTRDYNGQYQFYISIILTNWTENSYKQLWKLSWNDNST